jgi:hypothetical protein
MSLSPQRRGRSEGPETDDVKLTPSRRGKKSLAKSVSPVRVEEEENIGLRSKKLDFTSSPKKGKSPRSYDAPTSPGKSPVRRTLSLEDTAADIKVETPKKSPGRKESTKAVVSPSPATAISGLALHSAAHKIKCSPRVEKAYQIVRTCTGTLGGNGTTGAIYGELTMGSMQRVINLMVEKCELNDQSRFIDVGSGLGKPNLHAAQDPQCRLSVGVELETIRWQLSMYNLKCLLPECTRGKEKNEKSSDITKDTPLLSGVNFMVGDIDEADYTDPFTHIYMYDLGFPPPLQQSIANKFNNSQYAQYLISYRPPRRVIDEYGYDVEFVDQITTSMHGSGENHMAYFYRRLSKAPKLTAGARSSLREVIFPARPGFTEKTTTILVDAAFEKCVKLAVGDIAPLEKYATLIVDTQLLNSERPKRDRKPARLFDA